MGFEPLQIAVAGNQPQGRQQGESRQTRDRVVVADADKVMALEKLEQVVEELQTGSFATGQCLVAGHQVFGVDMDSASVQPVSSRSRSRRRLVSMVWVRRRISPRQRKSHEGVRGLR